MLMYLAALIGSILGLLIGQFLAWLVGPWSVPFLILVLIYLVHLRRKDR